MRRGLISIMHRCKACFSLVPNPKVRRLLESPTSSSVRECFSELAVSLEKEASHFHHGYVCRNCFLLVEKKIRLSKELKVVESTILSNLQAVFNASGSNNSPEVVKGTKRCRDRPSTSTTPKRMRCEQDGEQSVVVSSKFMLNSICCHIDISICQQRKVTDSVITPTSSVQFSIANCIASYMYILAS